MKDGNHHEPPQWASRFLNWYCSPNLKEQIIGDAEELFYWRLEEEGLQKARRAYVWDVLRFFRWRNIKRNSSQTQHINNISMFKNYFKIGWRNILRQKMPSLINIIGLSTAIACCLVAFTFIEPLLVKDRFHENGENIYLVAHEAFSEGSMIKYGTFSSSLADELPNNFPQINHSTRYAGGSNVISIEDNIFYSNTKYVDPDFFKSFSFPMVYGSKDVLNDPSKIVIDRATATKFFGDEYPIDKMMKVIFEEEEVSFSVGGVIENSPFNSSLKLSVVLNYEVLNQHENSLSDNVVTFIELKEETDVNQLQEAFQNMIAKQNGIEPDHQYESIFLVPLEEMASRDLAGAPGGTPPIGPIILLISIACIMLLLAVSNYVNIAILMASKRIKEIGIRKTIGSKRSQIIVQFLTENLILCALAIFLAIVVARGLFLPWFNEMSGLNIKMDLIHNQNLWLFLVSLLLIVTFLSGFYPAVYISRFKPSVIFRGKENVGKKWGFSGFIITFQLILSIITIVAGVMFVRTNNMRESIDWEFETGDRVLINIPESKFYSPLLNKMNSLSGVESVASTNVSLGEVTASGSFYLNDSKFSASYMTCGAEYLEFMGLELKEGRFFDAELSSDQQSSILINEQFAEKYGVSTNDFVKIDSVNYGIIGVLKDFHYTRLTDKIEPLMIKTKANAQLNYMVVKVGSGMEEEMEKKIREAWVDVVKNKPYQGFLQSSIFEKGSGDSAGIKDTMLFTASLATILAAMGIFGLASLSISSRMKDFGIKKVLGANLIQITKPVYFKFAIILSIAMVIGITLAIFIVGLFLDSLYPYHEPINFIPISFAALILTGVVFLTLSSQVWKVRSMRLSETLRIE